MRAQETRRGGRYVARERGSIETETEATPITLPPIPRGMLIQRLNAASLALVAEMLGCGVADLEQRYGCAQ